MVPGEALLIEGGECTLPSNEPLFSAEHAKFPVGALLVCQECTLREVCHLARHDTMLELAQQGVSKTVIGGGIADMTANTYTLVRLKPRERLSSEPLLPRDELLGQLHNQHKVPMPILHNWYDTWRERTGRPPTPANFAEVVAAKGKLDEGYGDDERYSAAARWGVAAQRPDAPLAYMAVVAGRAKSIRSQRPYMSFQDVMDIVGPLPPDQATARIHDITSRMQEVRRLFPSTRQVSNTMAYAYARRGGNYLERLRQRVTQEQYQRELGRGVVRLDLVEEPTPYGNLRVASSSQLFLSLPSEESTDTMNA